MAQLFPRRANWIARASLLLVLLLIVGLGILGWFAVQSPLVTGVGVAQAQPVPYSHAVHVGNLGLDCRYCHSTVEESNSASIPSADTCLGCHQEITPDSVQLAPLRQSLAEEQPLAWIRVHDLPDYVYFNHAIHVQQGVGCETCHGRVDLMPVVAKTETLQMNWCLDCHQEPERFLRPREEVFDMGYVPAQDQSILGPQLVEAYNIHTDVLRDCTICHR